MKALRILKDDFIKKELLLQSMTLSSFCQDIENKNLIHLKEAIKELEELENRSCSNCDDFDNEMDCDEFGFCTNNENNKDFKGCDYVRTKSSFCCNNWKNKA